MFYTDAELHHQDLLNFNEILLYLKKHTFHFK